MSSAPKLVIIGRPNVGKSTLFNRLFGRRRALVHDLPGVTRDRLEEQTQWWFHGKPFDISLVDTGGLGGEKFTQEIKNQVDIALSQADVALMLFDGQTGITEADKELLMEFKRSGLLDKIPVIGVVNKVDAESHETMINEFFESGLDPLITISAEHGRGIDDLKMTVFDELKKQGVKLESKADAEADEREEIDPAQAKTQLSQDESFEELDEKAEEAKAPKIPRIAVVGRPNVGKSTFVNALLGEHRMITSPIAGTTVDAIDTEVELNGKPYILIDTAGIRRKSKTERGVEVLSVVQTKKALERCDIAILLLDGEEGISDQDEKIGGMIEELGCSVILAMNKWDTQSGKKDFTKEDAAERIRKKMAFLKYAPILFMSAKKGRGFEDLGDLIDEILSQKRVKVLTHEFSEWVRKESTIHNPMNAKFYLCHQSGRYPPTFVCHVNDPKKIHFSLQRHLVNALRERWGFMGSPVRLLFVKGGGLKSRPKK